MIASCRNIVASSLASRHCRRVTFVYVQLCFFLNFLSFPHNSSTFTITDFQHNFNIENYLYTESLPGKSSIMIPTTSDGVGDPLILPTSQKPISQYHKMHANHTPKQKAYEVARAVRAKKKKIGVEMDYDSCLDIREGPGQEEAIWKEKIEVVPLDY